MSVVCGKTAGAAESKISNQPITFESNRIGIVQVEFESNLEASHVPTFRLQLTWKFPGIPAGNLGMRDSREFPVALHG